jgi:hypothetical protein
MMRVPIRLTAPIGVIEKGHSKFQIIEDDLNVAFVGGQQNALKPGPKCC